MYAVIETGGKQYRVAEGQSLKVELLPLDQGQSVDFDKVLMVVDGEKVAIGTPEIKGAKVSAEIVGHGRHKKINVIKFKRRKHHMKHMGHRQHYSEIKITKIKA